jgi:mannose-6-phosphate isomerase-like protein (cupin superfamily)
MNLNIEPFFKKVTKPWGEEIIYTPESLDRAGKILIIKAGGQLSFQYHDEKEETMCLFDGEAVLWLEDAQGVIQKFPMELRQGYTIVPHQKHRIVAIKDSVVLESSSRETGATVRLDDAYGRPDETESMRLEENRGWHAEK